MTTKTEFIARLSAEAGLTKKQASDILAALVALVYEDLESGEALLPGLGKLKVKNRGERRGRNPRTGESLTIPARSVVKFSPTRNLKVAVAGG